jgi:thiol-disulfide isomerase/thioredoxin
MKAMRFVLILQLILLGYFELVAQRISIKVVCPTAYFGKSLKLGAYGDNAFYQFYDSLKIDRDTVEFNFKESEIPDLFFLLITGGESSFSFFPEKGSTVILSENDLRSSQIIGSKSQFDWQSYQKEVQGPYESDLQLSNNGEKRARSSSVADSLNYWLKKQQNDRRKWLINTGHFVDTNPDSFVSLYLVRTNWPYFKEKGVLERLSTKMSYHLTYNNLLMSLAESSSKTLPNFRLLDYEGAVYTNKDFEGKYLIIDFWGTWCQPCIESIPMVRQAYLALKANPKVVFISIANEQKHTDPHKVAKTAAKLGIEWIQFIDHLTDPHSLAKELRIKGFPTLLVVNPENKIIRESLGDGIPDTLLDLQSLLKF